MSWTIYKKNGEERTVTLPLGASSRSGRLALPELEYNGEWMGETSVTLNVRCAVPVGFEIGDYIVYRGEKFVINYDPTVIKKARRGTYGEGFVYDNVKFVSLGYELTDMRMLDYVLNDNEIHYSSLPKFSFFCETVDDLADRLQVNADRYCSANGITGADRWVFVTPSQSRTLTRCGSDSALQAKARELYAEYFGQPAATDDEKTNQNVNIDNQSVWDAMKNAKDVFGLNFIQKGRSVVIGAAGLPTMDVFKYGKGNGLYEIERTADSDQQIVTMLMAYGSDKNLPTRYYANLNAVHFMTIGGIEENGNDGSQDNYLLSHGVCQEEGMFRVRTSVGEGWKATTEVRAEGDSSWTTVDVYCNANRSIRLSIPCATWQERLGVATRLYFRGNIDGDKWPAENKSYSTSNLPNNMAVNVLMLPGFPNQSLYDWVVSHGGSAVADEHNGSLAGKAQWHGYTAYFSKEKAHPFILSKNYPDLGIREATKYFDGSDGDDEIFPTIENTGKDTIVGADVIQDNGIFADGAEKIPTFKIILPDLGSDFKLDELLQSDTVIAMKNGYCGGREFGVESVKKLSNGTWECTCQRAKDGDLDLYFPYAHGTAGASLPYQLRTGDKYVLTGIEMTDTYVNAAAVKLLEEALAFLEKNDYTRYTYSPKVDEIFMARQHDGFSSGDTATYGTRSYHDTLKEGDVMVFADEDLNISGSVFIDVLRIKEYGNGQIPTYEVTLRNDKQVGTIQRLQEQVNSLATGGSITSGGGGGSVNIPQIRQLIQTYGKEWFLSKTGDDSASGLITFLKGLQIGAEGAWGYVKEFVQDGVSTVKAWFKNLYADYLEPTVMKVVDKIVGPLSVEGNLFVRKDNEGNGGNVTIDGSVNAQDGNFSGMLTTQNLTVTGLAHFFELMIDKLRSSGGAFVFTPADGFSVEDVTSTTYNNVACKRLWWRATDGETETDNQWLVGDQAICMSFNLARKKAGEVMRDVSNKMFWSVVCEKGTAEHDFGEDTALGHYITIYTGVNSSTPIATDDSGKPLWSGAPYEVEVGDDIAMLGHRMQAGEDSTSEDLKARQSAVYISAYASYDTGDVSHGIRALQPPLLAFYKGVDDFNLALHRGTFMDAKGSEFKGKFLSTSSSQEGIDIETLLSGSEVDIIYGNGNPNTVSTPHAAWSDAEKLLRVDKTLYFDLDLEPASEGGRLWKWTRNTEGEGYVWVQVNDIDSTAALDKISDVASDGKLTGGAEKTRVYLEWMDAKNTTLSLLAQAAENGLKNGSDKNWNYVYKGTKEDDNEVTCGEAVGGLEEAFLWLSKYLNNKEDFITVENPYTIPDGYPSWISPVVAAGETEAAIKKITELPTWTEVSPFAGMTGAQVYRRLWDDFYAAVVELNRALNAVQYKTIDEMGDDGLIDPAEKAALRQILNSEVLHYYEVSDEIWGMPNVPLLDENGQPIGTKKITEADGLLVGALNKLGNYLDGEKSVGTPAENPTSWDFERLTWGIQGDYQRDGLIDPAEDADPKDSTATPNRYPLWLQNNNDTDSQPVEDKEWDFWWNKYFAIRADVAAYLSRARQYQIDNIEVEVSARYETNNTNGANPMPGSPTEKAIKAGDLWYEAVRLRNPAVSDPTAANYYVTRDANGQPLYNVYECHTGYDTVVTYGNRFSYWRLVSQATYAYFDNDGTSIKAAVFNSSEFSLIEQKVNSVSSTVSAIRNASPNMLLNGNFTDLQSATKPAHFTGYSSLNTTISQESITDLDGFSYAARVVVSQIGSGYGLAITTALQPYIKTEKDSTYTLSAWIKKDSADEALKISVRRGGARITVGDMSAINGGATALTTSWVRYSVTFDGDDKAANIYLALVNSSGSNASGTFYVAGIQLEKSSSASAWQDFGGGLTNLQSQINQQADQISLAVKVDGVKRSGLTLNKDGTMEIDASKLTISGTMENDVTINGDVLHIENDLDIKGLTTENVTIVERSHLTPTIINMGIIDEENDANPVKIKSVQVKAVNTTAGEAGATGLAVGDDLSQMVVLPFYDSLVGSGSGWPSNSDNLISFDTSHYLRTEALYGHFLLHTDTNVDKSQRRVVQWKQNGTHISITNEVDYYCQNFKSIDDSYNDKSNISKYLLNRSVLVVADPRIVCEENVKYRVFPSGTQTIEPYIGSYRVSDHRGRTSSGNDVKGHAGCMSCGGYSARFCILLPGQTLKLRSQLMTLQGHTVLTWVVENPSDFDVMYHDTTKYLYMTMGFMKAGDSDSSVVGIYANNIAFDPYNTPEACKDTIIGSRACNYYSNNSEHCLDFSVV